MKPLDFCSRSRAKRVGVRVECRCVLVFVRREREGLERWVVMRRRSSGGRLERCASGYFVVVLWVVVGGVWSDSVRI